MRIPTSQERAERIVCVFGCFDLLHVGHLHFLERAGSIGNRLIVGVPSDDVVLADKGKPPIIPFADRMRMIAALKVVDAVQPYYHLEFFTPLMQVRPHVLAVGGDWGQEVRHLAAEDWAMLNGCEVVKIARYEGESTSEIRRRVIAAEGGKQHPSPPGLLRSLTPPAE